MKIAKLQVSAQFLVDALKGSEVRQFQVVANVLPDDAKYKWLITDDNLRLWLVVESELFTEIAEGDLIPELPLPVCRTVRAA